MAKKSDLPSGWAMPDDQANRLSENLSRKSISPERQLEKALQDIARDIAILEPNPADWEDWVEFFLNQLAEELENHRIGHDQDSLMIAIIDRLQNWKNVSK
jgi:hypothetical protein